MCLGIQLPSVLLILRKIKNQELVRQQTGDQRVLGPLMPNPRTIHEVVSSEDTGDSRSTSNSGSSQSSSSSNGVPKICANRECSNPAGRPGALRSIYCSKQCQSREQNLRQGRIKIGRKSKHKKQKQSRKNQMLADGNSNGESSNSSGSSGSGAGVGTTTTTTMVAPLQAANWNTPMIIDPRAMSFVATPMINPMSAFGSTPWVGTTSPPIQPTQRMAETQQTMQPVQQTNQSVQQTNQPVQQTNQPVQQTNQQAQSTEQKMQVEPLKLAKKEPTIREENNTTTG
eukprot:TRINITY_DN197_c0_g1_i11.p1 TRINITY_DN197_c0_g1~~TRINITY_DN197_c0_g1_i11.p1  ORF type:complete len:285 (-),score=17.99 TRINITY_DN197_c0_g1_i11:39-893(-)